jgi:hypothetical protein
MVSPRLRLVAVASLVAAVGCSPSKEEVMRQAEAVCRPVVTALELFHEKHGRYPATLHDLVAEGLLDAVPAIPEVEGVPKRDLRYRADFDADFFLLDFAYDIPGTVGPASVYRHYYASDRMEWRTRKYPPSMADLVTQRAGDLYRRTGTSKHLRLFFDKAIADPANPPGRLALSRGQLEEAIWEGEAVTVAGEGGMLYRARDEEGERYFLVYEARPLEGVQGPCEFVARLYVAGRGDGGRWRLRATGCR